jgi:DNA (cytosine-5)-methyltransferase 1
MLGISVKKNGIKQATPHWRKTCAEFFAGVGLMRYALERQGWQVLFANDNDPEKQMIYRGHFGDDVDPSDVNLIPVANVPDVTLATASFPCNDLSLAGARKGLDGAQSSAFWGFVRVLREMGSRRPPLVLLENVVGFLSSHGGDDFRTALLALNELGYAVDPFILDAATFVPQSRRRLFVVGSLLPFDPQASLNQPDWLALNHPARPPALRDFIIANPKIRWQLRALPSLPLATPKLEGILENLPHDSAEWWEPERAAYLLNQMSERHRALADKMIAARRWSYGTVFRRMRHGKSMAELRTDGIAGCLRTPRGGSGRQILFKAGWGRYYVRLITPREAARLMGADDFQLGDIPLNQALFGFGDAVCVPAIEWIAANVINPQIRGVSNLSARKVEKLRA